MSLAASPVMRSLRHCAAPSSPASRAYCPIVSLPTKPMKVSPFSLAASWVSLKMRPFSVPLVAQTSDWSQKEDEKEKAEESEPIAAPFGDDEWSPAEEEGSGEEEYPEPPEEAKLFVGNLPYDVDCETLAQVFNQAGVVEIAEVIYNRETDQSRGFGFVSMSTVEEAEKALEMFHRYDLNGRFLTVYKAAPRGQRPVRARVVELSFRIYVGNLPWQVDDARLEQVFSEHGKVTSARVVLERETGRSRGFGFVTMSSETEVNDAISALDGKDLDGQAIRVSIAESPPRHGSP